MMRNNLKQFIIGCEEVTPIQELQLKLSTQNRLRIKYSLDVRHNSLHLGHLACLQKLRHLQELGHTIFIVFEDYFATIADPKYRKGTRFGAIGRQQAASNTAELQKQIDLFLDKAKYKIFYTRSTFDGMDVSRLLNILGNVTVSQLLERDNFSKRFKSHTPIAMNEFLIPLMKAYDSYNVNADVELGGADQRATMLLGREIQRHHDHNPQVVMTMPLLIGTDGAKKMHRSFNNHIDIKDSPTNTLGKIMSIPDDMIENYMRYILGFSNDDINDVTKEVTNMRDIKMVLAMGIVASIHNKNAALIARDEFEAVCKTKTFPDNPQRVKINGARVHGLSELLTAMGVCYSNRAARKLVKENALHFYEKPERATESFVPKGNYKFRVGKKRYYEVEVS